MDAITAAYIAGLMDGEGCFRLDRFKTLRSPIGYQYRPIVEIAMCDRETIEFVARATDRHIQQKPIKSGRTVYLLVWRNNPACELIRILLPYLRGKKEQAELCLRYQEITPGRGRTYRPGDAVTLEALFLQIRALKQPIALRC